MDDTEEIKRKMLEQMQSQMEGEQQQKAEQEAVNAQKKAIMRQLLEPDARARLERIKLAKHETGEYASWDEGDWNAEASSTAATWSQHLSTAATRKDHERMPCRSRVRGCC